MQRAGTLPEVSDSNLPRLDDPLPSPVEQANSLILWIGDHQSSSAEHAKVFISELSAWIGTAITPNDRNAALIWLLDQDWVMNFVERQGSGSLKPMELRLNMAGWQRYEALKHEQIESHMAFMAMEFGHDELNQLVNDWFKPAVKAAGFELRVLTDGQPAGLIDDQLRVALRTARFVIADLTHGNNGAYWEAGFAEGLGRPVIYTCRKKEWDARDLPSQQRVHFDTNHHLTVIWDPEKLEAAATQLTATIRATLPAEAKMTN
jgi:hypothetical protein